MNIEQDAATHQVAEVATLAASFRRSESVATGFPRIGNVSYNGRFATKSLLRRKKSGVFLDSSRFFKQMRNIVGKDKNRKNKS